MSGTGYTDSRYTKTAICAKCKGYKTWNYWYHTNEHLCDDCYYVTGKYYNMSKEQAVRMEKTGGYNVDNFVILEDYHRRGKTVRLTAKLFESDDEEINGYGNIYVELGSENIIVSIHSHEYGKFELDGDNMEKLKVKVVYSNAYQKAKASYKKTNTN